MPLRRVLAIDVGQRRIKLLLAESFFGRFRVVRAEALDLQSEGLVSPEEIKAHLQTLLDDAGHPPVTMVLPQRLSTAQILDLPQAPESEVERLIADEALKLGGASESRIVYDFTRLNSSDPARQQFWVTLCREEEIRERIHSFGLEHEDICEITTTANALIASWQRVEPGSHRAVLVHLGAQSTVVVVLLENQGIFAASYEIGADFFTRSLAKSRQLPEPEAEQLRRSQDLLNGPAAAPEFRAAVDGWILELQQQLQEGFAQHPQRGRLSEFEWIASGGGFDQPGLLEYLRSRADLRLRRWPWEQGNGGFDHTRDPRGYEVAHGAALQALGHAHQAISLLPEEQRRAWRKRMDRQRVDLLSLALVCLCALVLAWGTWRKLSVIEEKEALAAKIQAAQEAVDFNDSLAADLISEYDSLRPVFAGQQNSLDTLESLALLQQSRSNRPYWYVLVSDQDSYFSYPRLPASTNRLVRTNLLGPLRETAETQPPAGWLGPNRPATNASPAKPGLIVELCAPGDPESARATLSELVKDLKQQPLFSKADLLSEDLRRNLADPQVVLPERHFVLALDFAHAEYGQPFILKKSAGGRLVRPHRAPTARENGPYGPSQPAP